MTLPDIFSFENVSQIPDMDVEGPRGLLINHTVEIVQSRSDRHVLDGAQQAGKIYVGPDDLSMGHYVKEIDFLLIHAQTISYTYLSADGRQGYNTVGARRYRTHKPARSGRGWDRDQSEEGRRTRWCASSNGVVPRIDYVGKDVTDIRNDETHRIGYRKVGDQYVPVGFNMNPDGTLVENPNDYVDINGNRVLNICGNCPFAKRLGPNDKARTPCEDAKRFIIYVLPKPGYWEDGFLASIMNSNGGVANALNGAPAKYLTARADGAALRGVASLFARAHNNVKRDVSPEDLTEAMGRFVVAYVADGKTFTARHMNWDAMQNLQNAGSVTHWVLELPTFNHAPEGLPEMVGRPTRVSAAVMRVADNGYTPPTKVPDMIINPSRLVTEDEYAAFLEARSKYFNDGVFSTMMRLSEMTQVTNDQSALLIGVSKSPQQLPSAAGDGPTTDLAF